MDCLLIINFIIVVTLYVVLYLVDMHFIYRAFHRESHVAYKLLKS